VAQQHLDVDIAGVSRRLPVRHLPSGVQIAYVQILGDVELCEAAAAGLVRSATQECDILVAPELKGIVLAHEIARLLRLPYVVLRKDRRSYMSDPVSVRVRSVTGDGDQRLWLSGDDGARIAGRRVWLVDDVVTTGSSLRACRALVEQAGGTVVEQLTVFTEGDEARTRTDVRALDHLPLLGRPSGHGGTTEPDRPN
jgi:adenine phosphoribosyltransferase